jgi:hypothetical protein
MRSWRVRGWMLLALGLFLAAFMGIIAMNMAPTMSQPGVEIDGTTFTGTAEQAQTFFLLFGIVIALGLLSAVNGLFMIATGRRSTAFMVLTLAGGVLLILLAWSILGGFAA